MSVTDLNSNVVSVRGFVPTGSATPSAIPQSARTPVASSSGGQIHYGSPILVTDGVVAVAAASSSGKISGHVLQMFGPDGGEVQNIPDNCGSGYEVIYDTLGAAGEWITHVSTAAYASTDIGKCYTLTTATETADAGTNRYTDPGDAYTNRCLDGGSEHNSSGQYKVTGLIGYQRSAAGVINAQVTVKYNASIYSAGEAS